MKKRLKSVIGVVCLSLALGACAGSGQNNPTNNPSKNEKSSTQYKLDALRPSAYSSVKGLSLEPGSYISIIGRHSDDSYWKEVESGAKQAIDDMNNLLGYKGADKIKLTYCSPSIRDDVNEQVNILDQELDRYPSAIAIATIDATACKIQFDLASENGIPIVTFDSGNDYHHIAAHVSTDNLKATQTAAGKLGALMEGAGELAIFVQDSVSTTAQTRLNGFVETIATDFPDISVVHVYHMDQLSTMAQTIADEQNASLTEGDALVNPEDISQEDVVKYVIKKYPELKGIYATNLDTTQLVAKVLKNEKKKDLKFVGFDGGEEQLKLLENGMLDGLITQNPYGMGYATVVAAARVSMGLGNESFVDTGFGWVTQKNRTSNKIKYLLY